MRTIDEFAKYLVDRYDSAGQDITYGAFQAGEFEVAAICIIEDAPVTAEDIDELERLAAEFHDLDREIAERVIAKRRGTPLPPKQTKPVHPNQDPIVTTPPWQVYQSETERRKPNPRRQ